MLTLADGSVGAFGGGIGNRGGSNYAGPVFRPEVLRADGRWHAAANAAEERTYHAFALLLSDGRVLTAGDDRRSHEAPGDRGLEVYSPPYLFRGARPRVTSVTSRVGYGGSITIATPDAARVERAVLMAPSSVTHATDMSARSIALRFAPAADGGLVATAPAGADLRRPGATCSW